MFGSDGRLSIVLYATLDAPRVAAKGKGTIGAKVIELAKAHDIPIEEIENKVLAGALSQGRRGSADFVVRLSERMR